MHSSQFSMYILNFSPSHSEANSWSSDATQGFIKTTSALLSAVTIEWCAFRTSMISDLGTEISSLNLPDGESQSS